MDPVTKPFWVQNVLTMAYHCAKKSLVLWIFLELSTIEIGDARRAISRASLWRSRWIKNTSLDLMQMVPSSTKPYFYIEGRILFLKHLQAGWYCSIWMYYGGSVGEGQKIIKSGILSSLWCSYWSQHRRYWLNFSTG